MGQTYQDLLNQLHGVLGHNYRNEPERDEAVEQVILSVLLSTLEKLRDQFDPS